jgi:hypothetical protein
MIMNNRGRGGCLRQSAKINQHRNLQEEYNIILILTQIGARAMDKNAYKMDDGWGGC